MPCETLFGVLDIPRARRAILIPDPKTQPGQTA
ncbi:hypothetical protein VTO73DRAFT_5137 [Trametes versicolor]